MVQKKCGFIVLILLILSISHLNLSSIEGPGKWVPQNSPTTSSLRGIWAVNKQVVWASGSTGTVLRTLDGGETWEELIIPGEAKNDFRDIYAIDKNTSLSMGIGSPAKFYKTSDGGKTWKLVYSNNRKGIFFSSWEFRGDGFGIAVSDPVESSFIIIITKDDGNTWNQVPAKNIPPPIPGEALFAASGSCIALREGRIWFATGGPAARLYRSSDSGQTWDVFNTPIHSGNASSGIFSVAFKDKNNGIIVGGDYKQPDFIKNNAAITKDGGKSWILIEDSPPSGFRSCVGYVPFKEEHLLIATGSSGSDFSTDGGLTWKNFDTFGYHSFAFAKDSSYGWAVGAGGRLARFKFSNK